MCNLCFLCFLGFFPLQLPPSVLWYCWLGLLTCKNRLPYNLYCVGGDVKHCTIQSCAFVFMTSHIDQHKQLCYSTDFCSYNLSINFYVCMYLVNHVIKQTYYDILVSSSSSCVASTTRERRHQSPEWTILGHWILENILLKWISHTLFLFNMLYLDVLFPQYRALPVVICKYIIMDTLLRLTYLHHSAVWL